jgi:hypothetical protein
MLVEREHGVQQGVARHRKARMGEDFVGGTMRRQIRWVGF